MATTKDYAEEITSFLTHAEQAPFPDVAKIDFMPSRRAAARVLFKDDTAIFVKKTEPNLEGGEAWLARVTEKGLLPEKALPPKPRLLFVIGDWAAFQYLDDRQTFAASFHPATHRPIASALGTLLGDFHVAGTEQIGKIIHKFGAGSKPQRSVQPDKPLSPQQYADMPGLDRGMFLSVAQRCSGARLALASQLSLTSVVHGDLLGTNILFPHSTNSIVSSFHIVDWDNAGIGDPAWDVGLLFAALLRRWLQTCDTNFTSLSDLFASAHESWNEYATWFEAFIFQYLKISTHAGQQSLQVEKTLKVAGHALLERSRNVLAFRGLFSQRETLLLSLSEQLLTRPSVCVEALIPSLNEANIYDRA